MAKSKTVQTSATLAAGVVLHSQVPMQTELERIFNWTAKRITLKDGASLDDKTHATIRPTARGHKAKECLGYFKLDGWTTRDGVTIGEIAIVAEKLDRDPYDIAETVIHETVHVWAAFEGVTDCHKSGKHTPEFAKYAERIGLVVEDRGDSKGHAYTSLGDDLHKALETKLKLKTDVFNMWRLDNPPAKKKKSAPKRTVYVCGCDIKASVSSGVTFDAVCNACATTFVPVE
jgi:hypothetical protein